MLSYRPAALFPRSEDIFGFAPSLESLVKLAFHKKPCALCMMVENAIYLHATYEDPIGFFKARDVRKGFAIPCLRTVALGFLEIYLSTDQGQSCLVSKNWQDRASQVRARLVSGGLFHSLITIQIDSLSEGYSASYSFICMIT